MVTHRGIDLENLLVHAGWTDLAMNASFHAKRRQAQVRAGRSRGLDHVMYLPILPSVIGLFPAGNSSTSQWQSCKLMVGPSVDERRGNRRIYLDRRGEDEM